jgi:putative NADH-flavin reductase
MRVVVFGATGKTGHHLVAQALSAGHEVRAFVRNASKLPVRHERLQIVEGEVLDAMSVEQAVSNTDAVLSALGHTKTSTNDVQTVGMENIVGAMKKNGISRLVSLTGAGVRDEKDSPKLVDRVFGLLLKLLQPAILEDAERHAEVIKASGLDWVIVRAPRLTDGPMTGEYRAGYVGEDSGTKISRADAAGFMLRQLIDNEYLRQQPMISY